MLTLIKNGEIYSPNYLGTKDILITGEKIGYIAEDIMIDGLDVQVIDATNKLIFPGFIDGHVHICGGGGEGGYSTRTPEIQLTDIISGGVTTVVGVLGTDGVTRTMTNLIAKAKSLKAEGITAYTYTGSYQLPVKTLTEDVISDLVLIDEIIGVGEIALSDHRSSQPILNEIRNVAANTRVGGILSNKAGIINIHMGDGERKLDYLMEIADTTEIPMTQFLPTHIGRSQALFDQAITYAQQGGYLDFTTSSDQANAVSCVAAVKTLLEKNVPIENITFTSDGQGSLPQFDAQGNLEGLGVGAVTSLYETVRQGILDHDLAIEELLKVITQNPANILKLQSKGEIRENNDADLVIVDQDDLTIDTVIAMGEIMVQNKTIEVKGTFE